MRIWCFTRNVKAYKDFDFFSKLYNRDNFSVIEPTQEVMEMMQLLFGTTTTIPFIGVAATPYGVGLNYDSLFRNINWLKDIFTPDTFMWELEVPEDCIIYLKVVADGYPYVTTNLLQYVRDCRNSGYVIQAILPYIKKEWVVSRWGRLEDKRYFSSRELSLYENMFPALRKSWCINLDEWNAYDAFGFDHNVYNATIKIQREFGSHGAPGYFTIEEVLACCDAETVVQIKAVEMSRGLLPEQRCHITLDQLFVP